MKTTSEVVHKVWDSWNIFTLATVHLHENTAVKIVFSFLCYSAHK